MDTFNKLVELFRQFPGIGPRQAKRFVYFLLSREPAFLGELIKLISVLKKETVRCPECFRFFTKQGSSLLCHICLDVNRESSELMVVAKDTDLEAMEKSNMYRGKYFVLGGTISLMEKEKRNDDILRLKEFQARIEKETKKGALKEVILALAANPDGEHTADELKALLSSSLLRVTILGRGLSTGSELEYADKETLKSALKNRSTS